jgi:hypothetical protein
MLHEPPLQRCGSQLIRSVAACCRRPLRLGRPCSADARRGVPVAAARRPQTSAYVMACENAGLALSRHCRAGVRRGGSLVRPTTQTAAAATVSELSSANRLHRAPDECVSCRGGQALVTSSVSPGQPGRWRWCRSGRRRRGQHEAVARRPWSCRRRAPGALLAAAGPAAEATRWWQCAPRAAWAAAEVGWTREGSLPVGGRR